MWKVGDSYHRINIYTRSVCRPSKYNRQPVKYKRQSLKLPLHPPRRNIITRRQQQVRPTVRVKSRPVTVKRMLDTSKVRTSTDQTGNVMYYRKKYMIWSCLLSCR